MGINISTKYINIATLFFCVLMLFFYYPQEKHLYYDEPFQIMCSKGVGFYNINKINESEYVTKQSIDSLNTLKNVFFIGRDSIHYILLHYIGKIFGSNMHVYVLFSVFWAISTLLAFYYFCRNIIGDSIFVSFALLLLFTDPIFLDRAYNVRHYMMTLFFIVVSGIYFLKYIKTDSIKNLSLLCLFCALSILSHYATIAVIISYVLMILYTEKAKFFSLKKLSVVGGMGGILLVYFWINNPFNSLKYVQSYHNSGSTRLTSFEYISYVLRWISVNYQLSFVYFKDQIVVKTGSVLILISMFWVARRIWIKNESNKREFYYLLVMGISSILFLTLISLTDDKLLSSRRHILFGIPFSVTFVAVLVKTIVERNQLLLIRLCVLALFIPNIIYFLYLRVSPATNIPCNHMLVIEKITTNNIHAIEVPNIADAVFINCFLPKQYDMQYRIVPKSTEAVLHGKAVQRIPLFNNDLIVLF